MASSIIISGARENNLKNVDLEIPKYCITALTGPSGSGKSSLAVNTLAAEGFYRAELFSHLAFGKPRVLRARKPRVSSIANLPPIVLMTKDLKRSKYHTVASYLGLNRCLYQIFEEIGVRKCPVCSGEITACSMREILDDLSRRFDGKLVALTALIEPNGADWREKLASLGIARMYLANREYRLDEIEQWPKEDIRDTLVEAVVERLTVSGRNSERLAEGLLLAMKFQRGGIGLRVLSEPSILSARYSPRGTCFRCGYLGIEISAARFSLSALEEPRDLSPDPGNLLGLRDLVESQRNEFLGIEIFGIDLARLLTFEIEALAEAVAQTRPSSINAELFTEVVRRMNVLGLQHLTLLRSIASLSDGEFHRVRLVRQLIERLPGLLYIIDEPECGLHPGDTEQLMHLLCELRASRHTIVLVSHDRHVLKKADSVVVFGPGAGKAGGQIVEITPRNGTATLAWGHDILKLENFSEHGGGECLTLRKVSNWNLKGFDVSFPLGKITCVTGVSGAGKTNLVFRTLFPAVHAALHPAPPQTLLTPIVIPSSLRRVVTALPTQRHRGPYSTVASFLALLEPLRAFYSQLELSRLRGYRPSNFSYLPGKAGAVTGACPACAGRGMSAQCLVCSACGGSRFASGPLDVRFREQSIADLLALSAKEASSLIGNLPRCRDALVLLDRFHLSYLSLAEPIARLSSGELQRLRLIKELANGKSGTLYLFEEPTSGLSRNEVQSLFELLRTITQAGSTAIATTHNLELIRRADFIVDLGPGAGARGGEIVASGTAEEIARITRSRTGAALRELIS